MTGDVQWLIEQSMLHQAAAIAAQFSGRGTLWRYPYALTQPRAASARGMPANTAAVTLALIAATSSAPQMTSSAMRPGMTIAPS